jgi:protein SCO1/2
VNGPSGTGARPGWPRALLWGLLVMSLAAIVVAAVLSRLARRAAELPPVLGEVPAFTLVDHHGEALRREDLAGHPWIADFIFTRCTLSCPLMTARMKDFDRRLPAEGARRVRLVSFTVDPVYDTPEVLAEYAQRVGASERWLFVTGERPEVLSLARDGFHLAVDPEPPPGVAPEAEPIIHSTRLVLVDSRGLVRGYYDALHRTDLDQLNRELAALLREGG